MIAAVDDLIRENRHITISEIAMERSCTIEKSVHNGFLGV
jgi:hypothetical protein